MHVVSVGETTALLFKTYMRRVTSAFMTAGVIFVT